MMKRVLFLLPLLALVALIGFSTQSAYAWCTPRILHCGDVIDSNTVQGHDDINRYNCTGSTNWNGKAHVYKINFVGDSLYINLAWTGNSNHTIGVFVLSACNQNTCIAYNAHNLALDLNPGEYWIIVDSRYDYGTAYTLSLTCEDEQLPVELLSFGATDAADGVHLNWTTATETNNGSFRLERQAQDREDWNLVTQINGRGQSSVHTNYSFVDAGAETGMAYAYRLVSVDLGGQTHELQLVTVTHSSVATTETPTEYRLVGNYPNPFNPSTRIIFDMAQAGHATVKVFDIAGRLVTTLASGTFEAGRHEINFDASDNPSGVYFAQFQTVEGTQMIKMVLMK
jgi:hypothetical protein